MPRIYTSTNDPIDFCRRCFPRLKSAEIEYADVGNGPDGRGNCFEYDASHPDYQNEDYRCNQCHKLLIESDNYVG